MREAQAHWKKEEPPRIYAGECQLLKETFGITDGLADSEMLDYSYVDREGQQQTERVPRVLILDPACGTGTFLSSIIEYIRESYRVSNSAGMWSAYVREVLLPRLFGFELLMAPYAMAHLRLGMQLAGLDLPPEQRAPWKYTFDSSERLGIYLTNSLAEGLEKVEALPFAHVISDEANEAALIKRRSPVMVVIGNPPYSGHSANKGQWIGDLLRGIDSKSTKKTASYFEVDGRPLGERNPKWLNDDYVKFLRFAQWRIEQTGYGVLAFITNHGYLDNPTFRGMRQSFMQTFDEIYILNLHGNSRKKEHAPDGSMDENVFDIQQGVAIGIFVKRQGSTSGTNIVQYADLWGQREHFQGQGAQRQLSAGKYHWLTENAVQTTQWTRVEPQTPYYLFIPQDRRMWAEYERGVKLTDIFALSNVGIVTGKDVVTIHWTENDVWKTVQDLATLSVDEVKTKYKLGRDAKEWSVTSAQKDIRALGLAKKHITSILYRPFDRRFTYYTGISEGFHVRPRGEVMRHMLGGKNIGMIASFQTRDTWGVLATRAIIGHKALAAYDINTLFPLYLKSNGEELFDPGKSRPNLSEQFIKGVASKLTLQFIPDGPGDLQTTFGPEDIFHYMYAVFYAPTYRERYAEFLKIDFPRVPLTSNPELFRALCLHGQRLIALHLLENVVRGTTGFQGQGAYVVEKIEYVPKELQPEMGCIWINKTQYFEDVPAEVWAFHIGGYQVCHKWLKDRKGRPLTLSDLRDYQRIISALSETMTLMQDIDDTIAEHGGWPIG